MVTKTQPRPKVTWRTMPTRMRTRAAQTFDLVLTIPVFIRFICFTLFKYWSGQLHIKIVQCIQCLF